MYIYTLTAQKVYIYGDIIKENEKQKCSAALVILREWDWWLCCVMTRGKGGIMGV